MAKRHGKRAATLLDTAVGRLERARALDAPAAKLEALIRPIVRPGVVEDTLSGSDLGHPAHPLLVTVPIGAWTSAAVLEFSGADRAAVQRLTAVGLLAALPTALTGASDWLSTRQAEQRVGLVHAAANYLAIFAQAGGYVLRRRGSAAAAAATSLAGLAALGVGGWLGGHMSYAQGVGVDTTAFQRYPDEWTDVADQSDVSASHGFMAEVDGVPILLARVDGEIVALADRCTHRGAPLHEGEVADGCVTCPWHDSVFDLRDGSVVSGPATRPQPTLEVRVTGGTVQVRRQENRALRTNPVGR